MRLTHPLGLVFPSLFPLFSVSLDSCVPSLRVSSSRIRCMVVVGAAPRPKSILERRRTRETERLPDEEARGTEITDLRASSDLAAYRGCRTIPLFDERSQKPERDSPSRSFVSLSLVYFEQVKAYSDVSYSTLRSTNEDNRRPVF